MRTHILIWRPWVLLWVSLAALMVALPMTASGARFEAKIGMLDPAVGPSDGVVFCLRVLDSEGSLLATLLETPVHEDGFRIIKRDLSRFGGRDVILQLEVSPGPEANVSWDWGVWNRPVVRAGDGSVLLDMLSAFHDAEVGYVVDGQATVVGKGVQYNSDGEKDYGLVIWQGEKLPKAHETLKESAFTVSGRNVLTSVIFMHPTWKEKIGTAFVRFPIKLPEGENPLPDVEAKEVLPPSFRGEIVEAQLIPAGDAPALSETKPPEDVDLTAMARWAMQYLINNPRNERGYETVFGIMPLRCPPCARPNEFDAVAIGDTENRMDWEFIFMREISGSDEGREVEDAIWKRILSYVRDDGLSWCPPYCLFPGPEWNNVDCAMNWTTGETLVSLVERYKRSGDEQQIALAKQLVKGLQTLASWDTGRAYYYGGLDAWKDGKFIGTGCQQQYPSILEPIVRYWEVTKDPEALQFATAFADGQVAGLQPTCGGNRINADGTFGGWNSHLHMRPVLGVAHLGALIGDPRYLDWSRRAYEHLRSMGADWGWFPESPRPEHPFSETCNTADMTDVALWLARAGYTEYWDHVERYVRNYTTQAQWFATPEYEALYRDLHQGNPAGAEEGLALMRRYNGGIHACLTPNAMAWARNPDGMNMMGCCPPEGMRTIYTAWSNTVLETDRGVEVNLSFNRDHPAARVISFLPNEGRLTVIAKKPADYFVRPPCWTPRNEVKAFTGGQPTEAVWKGDHILFANVKPNQELTITYPLIDLTQTLHVSGRDYTYHWLGNTVLSVEPKSDLLPIFEQVPRKLPELPVD